jgi:hypothetical protein
MNLRDRILERITRGGIDARVLYDRLRGEQASAVDCALGAMLRDHTLRLITGRYYLSGDPLAFKVMGEGAQEAPDEVPGAVRSAWPADLMGRRTAASPAPAHAPAQKGPKFVSSRLLREVVGADKQAAPHPSSEPQKTQCRECGQMLSPKNFQLLHGKPHHTCKRCHGMKARRIRNDGAKAAADAQPKAPTGSDAKPPVERPVGPGPVTPEEAELIGRLKALRGIKEGEAALHEKLGARARLELTRIDGLLEALQGGR